MKSVITTKNGDSGVTRALDGTLLPKDDTMIETVGALDTMRNQIALLRTQLVDQRPDMNAESEFLLFILHTCFLIGSAISDPYDRKREWHPMRLDASHLEKLEAEQARMESALQLPRAFIVCAANTLAAQADITASQTRTFERRLTSFVAAFPEFNGNVYQAYVNRLSDYFFILARFLEQGVHNALDYSYLTTM